jgi:two-component system chemotaxis sensor kinase CheA
MASDPYKYFRPEAKDLVGQLTAGFLDLEKRGLDEAVLAKLFRVAHTLKGAARIVKHTELASLAHALETWMAPLKDGSALPARLDEPLRMIDQMSACVAALHAPAPAPAPVAAAPTPVTPAPAPLISIERVDLGDLLDGLAEIQVQLAQLRTLDDVRHLPQRIDQLEREVRRVREETEQLQLVAASSLFPSLERIVRDAGASIDLVTSGGDTRLEASMLALLHGALVQLVRNAIAHGIEPAQQRRAAGKPIRARVEIDLAQRGGRVFIRVVDDGRGIDLDAVKRALERKGIAAPADRDALIRVLLDGGISTAASVTEMSGRGVGLDVVRDTAKRLGGDLSAVTMPGHGTTFMLSLPVSLSTLRALLVGGGTHVVGIPLACVREVVAFRNDHLVRDAGSAKLVRDDVALPYAAVSQILGGPAHPVRHVAIVDRGDHSYVALGVQHVLGVRDVVQRARPPGVVVDAMVSGLVIDDDGLPRPMLDAEELGHAISASRAEAARTRAKPLPILVIDDSLTTRMLEQSILLSAGYEVELASSAEEGLAKAQRGRYSLFLVDVEMPGMDGFTFVTQTRADPTLGKIPAILVTSRNAPEDLRRGAEAGAKGYIVKGEFDQNELLALIARLV